MAKNWRKIFFFKFIIPYNAMVTIYSRGGKIYLLLERKLFNFPPFPSRPESSSHIHGSPNPSAVNMSGQEPQKKIGEVGYTFRKLFDDGWFEGKGAVVFSLTAVSAPGEALVFCCVAVFSYHAHSLITFARMPSLFLDSCSNSGGST